MAKEVFGEYSAFTTKNSVRYQKNNKLVSETELPPEVVAYLNKQLGYTKPVAVESPALSPTPIPVEQKFPMPTEEEKARMREESLRVPENLMRAEALVVQEEPLTDNDFDAEVLPDLEVVIEDPMSEFMESVSIHTASLSDMVQAMYERFGIYSVYLARFPVMDEINPLTGEIFTKYHLGIAYQAAIRAQHSGVLTKAPEAGRVLMDEGRAASANFQVDPVLNTMGEARRANNFDFRTSVRGTEAIATTEIVHELQPDGSVRAVTRPIENPTLGGTVNGAVSRYDAEEDELLVQPNFSGKPVIRPNW